MRLANEQRDAGDFAAAAATFQRAVTLEPSHVVAWGQLGNMLKDTDRLEEAINAYRHALELRPDDEDLLLQFGRAQKLLGRREEAADTFNRALALAPALQDAAEELLALGEALPAATLKIGIEAVLKQMRDCGEDERPSVASLASIPLESYEEFRRLCRTAPPPEVPRAACVGFVVAGDDAGSGRLEGCVNTILAQPYAPIEMVLLVSREKAEAARTIAARINHASARVTVLSVGSEVSPMSALRSGVKELADAEFCIVLSEPLLLDPAATDWLWWPVARLGAVAAYCDEDRAGDTVKPVLRAAADIEAFARGEYPGAVLGIRRPELHACLSAIAEQNRCTSIERILAALCSHLAPNERIAHVPRILATRPEPRSGIDTSHTCAALPLSPPLLSGAIEIVIPTRDRLDLLAPCMDAFVKHADDPSRLRIHVVDAGSDEPETARYLAEAEKAERFRVTRMTGRFNWSRINNVAAAKSDASILLFSNNDIEILAPHWDTILRIRLADPRTGAVGALLLYPDQTIQHAGIVLGHNNQTEHEGRHWPETAGEPGRRFLKARTVGAVTGALMACRCDTFERVGGFDQVDLPVWYNDIDFCLRLREFGYRIVYEPRLRALHHESVTISKTHSNVEGRKLHHAATQIMSDRWGRAFRCDPYYSPYFGRVGRTFKYLCEPSMAAILEYIEASCDARPMSDRPRKQTGGPPGTLP